MTFENKKIIKDAAGNTFIEDKESPLLAFHDDIEKDRLRDRATIV
jgi:hypothetical protein